MEEERKIEMEMQYILVSNVEQYVKEVHRNGTGGGSVKFLPATEQVVGVDLPPTWGGKVRNLFRVPVQWGAQYVFLIEEETSYQEGGWQLCRLNECGANTPLTWRQFITDELEGRVERQWEAVR